jgi:UDP-N-acetylmuramate--alanine ligase
MKKHYHLMGIGGIGVSGLAHILLENGHAVSGCDHKKNALSAKLEARGVEIFEGHSSDHITLDVNVLVTSTAVDASEPEVIAARGKGLRVIRRIELLGELMSAKDSIGVVGTHGKTSTSSMIASVFETCGLEPTCVVGGEVEAIGGNAKFGKGKHFIAEIDESDTYFQHVKPRTAVITNVEDDHVGIEGDVRNNYHVNLEALHRAFRQFAQNADVVVYCRDWEGLEKMLDGLNLVSYGTQIGCDYRALDVVLKGGGAIYTLEIRGVKIGQIRLNVPGQHNVLNSLAAVAVADRAGIEFSKYAAAFEQFKNARRRWDVLGEFKGAMVVDDYAHNPTKVENAILGALTTGRRVRVVFQPHRYLRVAREWQRFAQALMKAHEVLLLDIYGAGEKPIDGIHSSLIEQKMIHDGHTAVRYYARRDDVLELLLANADENDVIVTMGAGDITNLGRELLIRAKLEVVA